jgi:hypothetical protein
MCARITRPYGHTPLYEQVGQLFVQHHQRTCWALTRPAPNKMYNLLGAGLTRTQHHDIASAQQVGQQVGSVEFISQQVVQQVRDCCNLLANKLVTCWPTCSYSGVWPLTCIFNLLRYHK